jgi:two-component system, chemotaxis family, chemotaxis protein CheY
MSKKILLVEDQEIERTALRNIIAAEPNWEVSEAADGHIALDMLCAGFRPQLCLVDLRMPNVDGLEFLRRVRRDPDLRALKVMIISASRDRTTIVELAKLGIEGYLLKPFDPDKTLSILRPVMEKMPDPDESPRVLRDLLTRIALVADDDATSRAALAALIAAEPHWEVIEAANGRTVLEKLRSGPIPDFCFLDLQMPEMDGLAVLQEIRRDPELENLRVAVTSGQTDRDKIRVLAQLKIDAYLLKPVDGAKVRAALRSIA